MTTKWGEVHFIVDTSGINGVTDTQKGGATRLLLIIGSRYRDNDAAVKSVDFAWIVT